VPPSTPPPPDLPRDADDLARDDARVDALLESESLLPLPLDLVARVRVAVAEEPAHGGANAPSPRLARPWRVAAAVLSIALGAHLAFEHRAWAEPAKELASVARLRLPATDALAAPIEDVLRAGGDGVRAVAGSAPAFDPPSLGAADAMPDSPAVLIAGGVAAAAAGLVVAGIARARASKGAVR
jgi:hypothetical protein